MFTYRYPSPEMPNTLSNCDYCAGRKPIKQTCQEHQPFLDEPEKIESEPQEIGAIIKKFRNNFPQFMVEGTAYVDNFEAERMEKWLKEKLTHYGEIRYEAGRKEGKSIMQNEAMDIIEEQYEVFEDLFSTNEANPTRKTVKIVINKIIDALKQLP